MYKNMLELNGSNLDEYLYKFSGETPNGWFWRFRMRTKWWWQEFIYNHFIGSKTTRQFLHKDLQQVRYHPISRGEVVVLRYIDEKGELVAQEFKMIFGYQYIEFMELEGSTPYPAKPIKGPKTFKLATHTNTKYSWWVLRRSRGWSIDKGRTI